ncbi:MAG: hypothetical protein MJ223_03830 [Mycoplasmoidaceae bacterium]|nr:hypothetical protein [Mycoplasmoidaceae bacterium]
MHGIVHGVVVQITTLSFFSRMFLPSTTLKPTKIEYASKSLYSISASAKAV